MLSDDLQARAVALRLGIPVIGVVGLFIKAKQAGLITSLGDELERAERPGGLYLTEELKQYALRVAGETDH